MALTWREEPPSVAIEYGQGRTTATIHSSGSVMSVVLNVAVLAFWTFGGLFAVVMLQVATGRGETGAFFMVWLGAWIVGEVVIAVSLLWKLFGRTVIVATPRGIEVARQILGLGGARRIAEADIRRLAFQFDDPSRRVRVNGKRIPQPALLAFTSRGIHPLVRGISREDGEAMIAAFNQRLLRGRTSRPIESSRYAGGTRRPVGDAA